MAAEMSHEKAADLCEMLKHEKGMEDEWEEMEEGEKIDSGMTWHIKEMDEEDPMSDMKEEIFGGNGMEAVMVGEFTIPSGTYMGPSFCKVVNKEIK